MKIFAEVIIDETGIIEQIDKVKDISDKLEDEMLKLRGMLVGKNAIAKIQGEKAGEK